VLAGRFAPSGLELAATGPVEDGGVTRQGMVAVVSGRIDNREQLVRAAGLDATTSPADLVAALYGARGDELLEELRGSFALLVWDGHAGLLAVDPLGAGGLFHAEEDRALLFASEAHELLGLARRTPDTSLGGLARFVVDGALAPAETVFAGVRRLRGGHFLWISSDGWEEREYRRPRYRRPTRVPAPEAAATLLAGVESAVLRSVEPGEAPGILLSGGVDSGTVATLAASAGLPLRAYSAVFPEHPSTDESKLVDVVSTAVGMPSSTLAFSGGGLVAALFEYVRAWRVPPAAPNLFFQLPLLHVANEDGRTVLLDGQGGDELFGASPFLIADRLARGRLLDARRLALAYGGPHPLREYGLKGLLPWFVHHLRRSLRPAPPRLLTAEAAETYREENDPWRWKRSRAPRWWAFACDLLTSQRERSGAHDFLRHKFALGGVEGRHPFLADLELIELVLQLPPEYSFGTPDRPLLRAALRDRLPEAVRARPEKAYFDQVLLEALAEDESALRELLGEGAQVHRIVRRDLVERSVLGLAPAARAQGWAWLTWRLLSAEVFLRTMAEPSFPARALETWELSAPRYSVQSG